jgi:hypothetical protein
MKKNIYLLLIPICFVISACSNKKGQVISHESSIETSETTEDMSSINVPDKNTLARKIYDKLNEIGVDDILSVTVPASTNKPDNEVEDLIVISVNAEITTKSHNLSSYCQYSPSLEEWSVAEIYDTDTGKCYYSRLTLSGQLTSDVYDYKTGGLISESEEYDFEKDLVEAESRSDEATDKMNEEIENILQEYGLNTD